ncbi:sulfatase-like hydrolase/transferase [Permianibacter sp. IMCC34836]|uniref:LTA synthase family protein n=1 Tax=Permianibacter fluminis TaxID=2738515 RepID=UPI001553C621|nr:alkaline phosphatase family protein [Permianibacter fluminis]NQD35754.1 sulfatase-like hydrolase/transferase [Permianibacter fluminis]
MSWLRTRRPLFLLATVTVFFLLFVALRAAFYLFFSEVNKTVFLPAETVWQTVSIGLRFDLRLAILMTLPLALLAFFPKWNLLTSAAVRLLARIYLIVALLLVLLIYMIDFGHYQYLGIRIDSTVYRYFKEAAISAQMVWQSYPVIWIVLGHLTLTALVVLAVIQLEKRLLARPDAKLARGSKIAFAVALVVVTFHAMLGRASNINYENPVPLRWADAAFSGDRAVTALGINPVLYLYDTSEQTQDDYDLAEVKKHYPTMIAHLGVDQPTPDAPNYDRMIPPQPHRLNYTRKPNVVFIMMESLGASRLGAWGNPLNPTPNLDRIAHEGWMFQHFYVPVTGTAKTVWASITGIPDVSKKDSATRNPRTPDQRVVVNNFKDHKKFYLIGGNAGWANMSALIVNSVDGVTMLQEDAWKDPLVNVWGISDLDLFKNADKLFRSQPADQPFFAIIQSAGNHKPFTIPEDRESFKVLDTPDDELAKWGFESNAQFNAVRFWDYSVGRFFEMAKAGGYLDNTIFVMYGDHNNRITTIPHMPKFVEDLNLDGHHVPGIIYAPGYLQPRVIDEPMSLVDMFPTVAGLLGEPYLNTTLGQDFQMRKPEQQAIFLLLTEGYQPTLGGLSKDYLVRMKWDGSNATLHALHSDDPKRDVAKEHPDVFAWLSEFTKAEYETARYQFYQNRKSQKQGTLDQSAATAEPVPAQAEPAQTAQ